MIIILKKDGQIVTDDGNPIEGAKLENAAAVLADPKDGDTIVYDANAGMWVAGTGGGSFEPDITNPQDGDTLVYDASEGKWVNGSGGGSGGALVANIVYGDSTTLDKTAGEIVTAFDAGKTVYVKQDDSFDNPEYGYTDYTYMPLQKYKYHNTTGTEEDPITYWEFKFDNNSYTANNSTDYPALAD